MGTIPHNRPADIDRDRVDRAPRRTAYLPVQIRRFKWLPLIWVDAQLLDASVGGVKLQCGRDVKAKPGDVFWVSLSYPDPQGDEGNLMVRAECRWYAKDSRTLGAAFSQLGDDEAAMITQLLDHLRATGRLEC